MGIGFSKAIIRKKGAEKIRLCLTSLKRSYKWCSDKKGKMRKWLSDKYKRLVSARSKLLLGLLIIFLAIFHELFPWTTQRGWSYAVTITNWLNNSFGLSLTIDKVYGWEAKVLAYTSDVAFFMALLILALLVYEVFIKKDKALRDEDKIVTKQDIKDIMQDEFKKLREEINKDGNTK